MKVAIQGYEGSFHEIAARKFFKVKEIEVVYCKTFQDQFKLMKKGGCDFILMAIENSVVGSILPNYGLVKDSKFKVVGEIYLRIAQNLMCLPDVDIKNITEVHSHYMAIEQCRKYLTQYEHIKLVESEDTALSAQRIREQNLRHVAAIASELAAKTFSLKILKAGIETNKRNFTRFLAINKEGNLNLSQEEINKASICFTLPHKVGSLSQVLSVLSFYNMDLTKIQSLPVVGEEWRYFFYVDIKFEDYNRYKDAISAIVPLTDHFEILGEYKNSEE